MAIHRFPLVIQFSGISVIFQASISNRLFFRQGRHVVGYFHDFLTVRPIRGFRNAPGRRFGRMRLFHFLPIDFVKKLDNDAQILRPDIQSILHQNRNHQLDALPGGAFRIPVFQNSAEGHIPPQIRRAGKAGLKVPHDLTQEEMAQLVGSSRETVNKALMDFANRGWIAREGRSIIIYQPGMLIRRSRR